MGQCTSALSGKNTLKIYEKPDANTLKQDRNLTKQYEETLQFLQKVPLFLRLPPADQPMVGLALVSKTYSPSEFVIKEHDEGNEFFIIQAGEALVLKGEKEVARLRPGDYFGEASLLEDIPRNASVMVPEDAKHSLKTLSITREKFEELGVRERLRFPRRRAVAADDSEETPGDKSVLKCTDKTDSEEALIKDALVNNKYLSAILKPDQINQMVSVAWKSTVKQGTQVIEEGSLSADRFYVISSGNFTVKKMICKEKTQGVTSMEDDILTELEAGQTFGELALLYNAPRAATVEAVSDAVLWVIDRHDFKKILRQQAKKKLDFYMKLIANIELISCLLYEEKQALVECFVELHYRQGQEIMKEGDKGSTFYILYQGTVGVYKDGQKINSLTADPSEKVCPYFGEVALLSDDPRNATIMVESNSAALLVLDRSTFESILGPLKDIMQDDKKRKSLVPRGKNVQVSALVANFKKPKFEDLSTLGLLGAGGFGAVRLVKDRSSKKTFALKAISKGYVMKMHLTEQIVNERKILAMTSSCYITQFYCSYNSANHLYFLMEACLGGEIFAIYNRKKFHGSTTHAKFYSASVVQAFQHLHERKIIYRDLKPENMLLDNNGYCKLTDMGLAKFVIGRTYTTCGTPDYFAPEIIQSCGHTNAVDWWTFGILIFELLCGHPPFDGLDPMVRYKRIVQGFGSVKFPNNRFSAEVVDLIKEVCHKDPSQRLPMRPGGVKENLYQHAFYKDFDWVGLDARKYKPVPYKPRVKNVEDISNFQGNTNEEDCPPTIPYEDPGTGWDASF